MKLQIQRHLFAVLLSASATAEPMRSYPTPLVVDPRGVGTFRTIQAALDSLPDDAPETRVILIKALANLTVHNNYGSLHGDNDHQFAIRSGGAATRLSLLSVDAIADGGDTVSLWNTATGMYYFADCYFEGYVDYVCPRGWCYTTDSRFFGHNKSASIWHDGNQYEDSKFVIRNSHFDGIPGFALGRNTRDGQFFILDSFFSRNMADKPIYDVYFGETPDPPLVGRVVAPGFDPGMLKAGATYHWRIDTISPRGRRVVGPSWTFYASRESSGSR